MKSTESERWGVHGPYGEWHGHGVHYTINEQGPGIDGGHFAQVDALHWTSEAAGKALERATLMAAAPVLLKACCEALQYRNEMPGGADRDAFEGMLRGAIAKARDYIRTTA